MLSGMALKGGLPGEQIVEREKVKERVGARLLRGVSDEQLARLLRHVGGDADLAATAMFLLPRPDWLEAIVGPLRR